MEIFYANKQSQSWLPEQLLDWLAVMIFLLCSWSASYLHFDVILLVVTCFCPYNLFNGCLVAVLRWPSLLDTRNNPFPTSIFSERACNFAGLASPPHLFPLSCIRNLKFHEAPNIFSLIAECAKASCWKSELLSSSIIAFQFVVFLCGSHAILAT